MNQLNVNTEFKYISTRSNVSDQKLKKNRSSKATDKESFFYLLFNCIFQYDKSNCTLSLIDQVEWKICLSSYVSTVIYFIRSSFFGQELE